jgi:hypothetical protein
MGGDHLRPLPACAARKDLGLSEGGRLWSRSRDAWPQVRWVIRVIRGWTSIFLDLRSSCDAHILRIVSASYELARGLGVIHATKL